MREHDDETVRGLPGPLPAGETMLWQGAPDWRVLARTAFHVRGVAIYFALLAVIALASGAAVGALATVGAGLVCLGLLYGIAMLTARMSVYTLTDRRVVLRIGIALPKCLNLPLVLVEAADLRPLGAGAGDIALEMGGQVRLGYLLLWPHARPFRLKRPTPMLRAVPDAEGVAAKLAAACAALGEVRRAEPVAVREPLPTMPELVAA